MNDEDGSAGFPAGAPETDWMPQVYDSLRELARRHLAGERAGQTLSTTALVHEAWLSFSDATPSFRDRAQFFAYAATTMRHILVDRARRRMALKRGGGDARLDLDAVELPVDDAAGELLALDRALDRLASLEPRLSRVVELRFFAGLSVEQTAELLEIVPRSVVRDWARARAFLLQAMA